MKKTLRFTETIHAPAARVWDTMLAPDAYEAWTAEFCEGSRFEGSWSEGAKIRFLGPDGHGMVAVIAANRPFAHLSIQHLGEVKNGVEDTTSAEVRAWAPAFETFDLTEVHGGTELCVTIEVVPASEVSMQEAYPRALGKLRALCESLP